MPIIAPPASRLVVERMEVKWQSVKELSRGAFCHRAFPVKQGEENESFRITALERITGHETKETISTWNHDLIKTILGASATVASIPSPSWQPMYDPYFDEPGVVALEKIAESITVAIAYVLIGTPA